MKYVTILFALGCATSAKPAEDNIPLDGKADSFFAPTEHGQLTFNTPHDAELSDSESFHAWWFRVGSDSDVEITVYADDPQLDTVLYLYHRDEGAESWGRYIDKNDDDGDSLQSALAGTFEAGEYRIIIKGHNEHHHGAFSVEASCDGQCGGVEIPEETGFSTTCGVRLMRALNAPIVSVDRADVHPSGGGYSAEVQLAVTHYASLGDWAADLLPQERAEHTFDTEIQRTTRGTLITIRAEHGTLDYAFDPDGQILSYYVHNDTPWTGWFCEDGERDPPDERCVGAWFRHAIHFDEARLEFELTWFPGEANDEVTDLMQVAIDRYRRDVLGGVEESEGHPLDLSGFDWLSPSGGGGALVVINEEAAYTLVQDGEESWFAYVEDGRGTRMCE